MAQFTGKAFKDAREIIDGNSYENCTFDHCKIVYRGGDIPRFLGCKLDYCEWVFEDAAQRTFQFMKGIYSGMGPGGRQIIEDIFKTIRNPAPTPPRGA